MTIKKIVSGAQQGADISGLRTAKKYGILTGGHAPKYFKTEDGYHPEYAELYNLIEDDSTNYRSRTIKNILNSDGTIIFALDFNSSGSRLTFNECIKNNKLVLKIYINSDINLSAETILDWIKINNIEILNCAGNRKSVAPNIENFVETCLSIVFEKLGFKEI